MLAQHVVFVCTPMLHDVGICCVQFETSQTFCPTYANISFVLVIEEAYRNMLCSFFAVRTQHTEPTFDRVSGSEKPDMRRREELWGRECAQHCWDRECAL